MEAKKDGKEYLLQLEERIRHMHKKIADFQTSINSLEGAFQPKQETIRMHKSPLRNRDL